MPDLSSVNCGSFSSAAAFTSQSLIFMFEFAPARFGIEIFVDPVSKRANVCSGSFRETIDQDSLDHVREFSALFAPRADLDTLAQPQSQEPFLAAGVGKSRSEEHTSELQ